MTELPEDRVFARHPRRRGAVLIIGAGAVGGFLAEELARMGFSPIHLVDRDVLEVENLIRHPLGAQALGQPKASALASKICLDFPVCDAFGHDVDFLALTDSEQRQLVGTADVVVAATDNLDCQRHVNVVALAEEKPAVYPAVWVDPRIRDAEVGEILWVLPGRHTPCYECAAATRLGAPDAEAARGARADIQQVSLAAARVVAALLDPTDEQSAILDPERTAIYLHGLTPTSPGVRPIFPAEGLQSRNVRVHFPPEPCPVCHGHELPADDPVMVAPEPRARPTPGRLRPAATTRDGLWRAAPLDLPTPVDNHRRQRRVVGTVASVVTVCALILVVGANWTFQHLRTAIAGPTSAPTTSVTANPSSAQPRQAPPAATLSPQPIPPTQTELICNVSLSSSYATGGSDCTSGDMYSGDTIVLEVNGVTRQIVNVLCQGGDQDEWTTSRGPAGGTTSMCADLSDGMGFDPDGNLVASFSNPGVLGPDTVTWRLIGPSGQVTLQAQYTFTVLDPLYSSASPAPS